MKGRPVTAIASLIFVSLATAALFSPWRNAARLVEISRHSRVVATARGPVEYGEAGSGPPVLVFHGTPGGFDAGLKAAEMHLPPEYRRIAISRPGYLRTPLGIARTPEAQADLGAALLDAIGLPRVFAYAYSGGGPAALQFAARHPLRCRGLILIAAVNRRQEHRVPLFAIRAAQFTDLGSWWAVHLLPEVVRVLTPIGARAAGWENDEATFAGLPEHFSERVYRPALIVHGTADSIVSIRQAEEIARAIPGSRYMPVAGAGHLDVTNSPEARRAIAEFLAHPR